MRYTNQQLLELLKDLESDYSERKESFRGDAPEKAKQAICAFANDLPDHKKPGVLFVGAKDNGTPSLRPITDELLRTLADIKTNGEILPMPVMTVEKVVLDGAPMAVVTVQPSDMPPVKFKGRIWIRTGPRRSLANAQEERILNEKRRYKNIPFDIYPVPSSSLNNLSQLAFETDYLPYAFSSDILRGINDKFKAHNRMAMDIISQPTQVASPLYPPAAFQQLVYNAVLHRTYESTNSPVRVYWFDDRIEIHSPGGPYGNVTRENFGNPGITDYRNPDIATVLKNLGFVQTFGRGIATAKRELERNGNPPLDFDVNNSSIVAIIRKKQ